MSRSTRFAVGAGFVFSPLLLFAVVPLAEFALASAVAFLGFAGAWGALVVLGHAYGRAAECVSPARFAAESGLALAAGALLLVGVLSHAYL